MKISAGDYLVLDLARPSLAKCVSAEKPYRAILERDRTHSDGGKIVPVDFKLSDVLANVGKSPRAGSVHGVKIEPLFRTEESKFFGEVRIYQDMTDARWEAFKREMVTFIKTLKAKKLVGVPTELEVRPVSGKYAGYYKHRPKNDLDITCVRPNESLDNMQYIFAHEYGHGVHFRMMPRPIWLKWVKMYHDHVQVNTIDEDELAGIREEIESQQSMTEYLKECAEDVKPIIKQCTSYIVRVHGLGRHHVELMLNSGESLESIWPSMIDLSLKDMAVSEYAEKSPEEFFAESFAYWFMGRKLPKGISALMERTLTQLVK